MYLTGLSDYLRNARPHIRPDAQDSLDGISTEGAMRKLDIYDDARVSPCYDQYIRGRVLGCRITPRPEMLQAFLDRPCVQLLL